MTNTDKIRRLVELSNAYESANVAAFNAADDYGVGGSAFSGAVELKRHREGDLRAFIEEHMPALEEVGSEDVSEIAFMVSEWGESLAR